mmetsp:Transcript_128631/g.222952  ORF Transcript_128631/g.222952 Transcript_128631/m.222952 type:complete len:215 (+) Transcript_128631:558-1202(+)
MVTNQSRLLADVPGRHLQATSETLLEERSRWSRCAAPGIPRAGACAHAAAEPMNRFHLATGEPRAKPLALLHAPDLLLERRILFLGLLPLHSRLTPLYVYLCFETFHFLLETFLFLLKHLHRGQPRLALFLAVDKENFAVFVISSHLLVPLLLLSDRLLVFGNGLLLLPVLILQGFELPQERRLLGGPEVLVFLVQPAFVGELRQVTLALFLLG